MATTLFSDEIIGASELRSKQKYWFTKASKQPVTVTDGSHRLVIANRDKIRSLLLHSHHLELAVKYCSEELKQEKSSVFPWLKYLDETERKQFHKEFMDSVTSPENWEEVETLIEDWKATAETEGDVEAMKVLRTKQTRDKYIPLRE